jgi:hypothetical protein
MSKLSPLSGRGSEKRDSIRSTFRAEKRIDGGFGQKNGNLGNWPTVENLDAAVSVATPVPAGTHEDARPDQKR